MQLKGIEIIKDLDNYFEKNKSEIKDKVIKSKKYKTFAKTKFEREGTDDFQNFKIEITKHILKDLQKYCLIK